MRSSGESHILLTPDEQKKHYGPAFEENIFILSSLSQTQRHADMPHFA